MKTALTSVGAALQSMIPAAVVSHQHKHKRSKSMPICKSSLPFLAENDFQMQLVAHLDVLQQQHQPSSCTFTADWLGKALEVVLFIYSNVEDLQRMKNDIGEKWLSQHMEDVINLLDVCNVLIERISQIKKYNMSVQIALRGLLHGLQIENVTGHPQVVKSRSSLASCMDALRKKKDMMDVESNMDKCMSTLRRMAGRLQATSTSMAAGAGNHHICHIPINNAMGITIFACTALVAALSFNTPRRSSIPTAACFNDKARKNKISPLPLTADPLINVTCVVNTMQNKIKEVVDMQKRKRSSSSSSLLFHELDRVDITVGNISNLLDSYFMTKTCKSSCSKQLQDQLKASIEALSTSTTELESALTCIEHKISELFKLLISSRVAHLNTLSHS